jgi:hypothetical protein
LRYCIGPGRYDFFLVAAAKFRKAVSIPGDDAIERELLFREQMAKIVSTGGSQATSWSFFKTKKI